MERLCEWNRVNGTECELKRLKFGLSNELLVEQVWYGKRVCIQFVFIVRDYEVTVLLLSTSKSIQFDEKAFWRIQEPGKSIIKVFSFLRPQEFADAISHFRVFSFARRSAISVVSVKREISADYVFLYIFVEPCFIWFYKLYFSLKVKTLTAVVSALTRLSVNLSTSCPKLDSSRKCPK